MIVIVTHLQMILIADVGYIEIFMSPSIEISTDPLNSFHILLLQLVHENFHGPFW